MKNLITIYILMIFSSVISAQDKVMIDRVVAQVGGEIVLLSDIEERVAQMAEQQGLRPEDIRCQILESVMLGKMMVNQAKLDSVEVGDAMVEGELTQRFDYIMSLFGNDPQQFRAYYGKSMEEMRDFMRGEIRDDLTMREMRRTITADIRITPREVTDFFNQIPKDSLPYFNSEVEVSELVYIPTANEDKRQEAIQKLKDIKTRIEAGESFEDLAKIFSDDLGSARNGGDLGWMKRGSLVPEFEAVAYNLEAGQISDVTESEFGMHLIQLIERRGNSIHSRHILIKPKVTPGDLSSARDMLDSLKKEIMIDSLKFPEAVKKFSSKKVQSYYNSGRMTNPSTGNTFFEVADLDPETFFAIDTLEVGEVAGPVEIVDPSGQVTYKLIQLNSRSEPHRANLRQDYTKIQEAAINKKKAEVFDDWAREVIQKTFIEVIPEFESCPNLQPWLAGMN